MRQETRERKRKTIDRRQGTTYRRQDTGHRRRERKETVGDTRQERQQVRDIKKIRETGDDGRQRQGTEER